MSANVSTDRSGSPAVDPVQRRRARRMLVLLFVVCAAPAVAAYLMYFVFKPQGGTSAYGKLIEPQRPLPTLVVHDDETGENLPLSSLRGK
ncbi:cytochrome C oxidase subunit I, partial [Pandoraea sputorum]